MHHDIKAWTGEACPFRETRGYSSREVTLKPIKAKLLGYQVWRYGRFALYTLLEPMGEHKANDTVSLNTIKLHGYRLERI
jgi:hypothetical protein